MAIIKEIKSLVEGMNLVQVCIETENLFNFVDWDVLASKVPLLKQTCFTGEEICGERSSRCEGGHCEGRGGEDTGCSASCGRGMCR